MVSTPEKPTLISSEQYPLVVSRRQAFDALIWQTPVLSLTAQAFLFSISLTAGSSEGARIISAALALFTALAAIQLMVKHRYHEQRDSRYLQAFEKANNMLEIHGRGNLEDQPWYVRWSSYEVWVFTLSLFAAAAIIVLLSALLGCKFLQ